MSKTTQEERDDIRGDPSPQPEDVRRVCDDADRLKRAEELLRDSAVALRYSQHDTRCNHAEAIDTFLSGESNG